MLPMRFEIGTQLLNLHRDLTIVPRNEFQMQILLHRLLRQLMQPTNLLVCPRPLLLHESLTRTMRLLLQLVIQQVLLQLHALERLSLVNLLLTGVLVTQPLLIYQLLLIFKQLLLQVSVLHLQFAIVSLQFLQIVSVVVFPVKRLLTSL